MVPLFGPALRNIDYVIEYVKKVKNKKGRNTDMFAPMYKVIANPASLSDEDIWIVILKIIRNFDFFYANTYTNRKKVDRIHATTLSILTWN